MSRADPWNGATATAAAMVVRLVNEHGAFARLSPVMLGELTRRVATELAERDAAAYNEGQASIVRGGP
jgi:hypothetical protein